MSKGNVVVFASAGSGKTAILVERTLQLIKEGVSPFNIRVCVYNKDASLQVRKRLGRQGSMVQVSTIHSWCFSAIKRCYSKTGQVMPKLITSWEAEKYMLASAMKCGRKKTKGDLQKHLSRLALWKNNNKQGKDDLFLEYEKLKKQNNKFDFEDMMLYLLEILERDDDFRKEFQEDVQYLMVDEFQDVNIVMYKILSIYAKKNQEFFVVGDDKQAIYGWRGASSSVFRKFIRDFEPKVIELGITYRNSNSILDVSNKFSRIRKQQCISGLGHLGSVNHHISLNEHTQGELIAEIISEQLKWNKHTNIVVLYRLNALSLQVESALLKAKIPYSIVGGNFFKKEIIKTVLAYLSIFNNPDSKKNIKNYSRILNKPLRFIRNLDIKEFEARAKEIGCLNALDVSNAMKRFKNEILLAIRIFETNGSVFNQITYLRENMGLDAWLKDKSIFENGVVANNEMLCLEYFHSEYKEFKTLDSLLEKISEMTKIAKNNTRVNLMTIHKAKGLEYDFVHLINFNEGILPYSRNEDKNEEENLFYVALTRARHNIDFYSIEENELEEEFEISSFYEKYMKV